MIGAWLRPVGWIAAATFLGFLLYVALFAVGAGAGIDIMFYRGIVLAGIVAAVTLAGLAWLLRGRDPSLAIAAAVASFSFNICFLVLLPVTVDRSVTVYLLSTIGQHPAGLTALELERSFVDGYVVDMGAIERRIAEQGTSGNIMVSPDRRVRLTPQGQRFLDLSRAISTTFGADPRFVTGATPPSRQ